MNYSNLWDINPNAIPTYSAETAKPEVKKTPTFANNIYSDFRSDIADKAKEADFNIDFAKDFSRALVRPFIENSGSLGNFLANIPNYIINDIPRAAYYAGQSIWDNPIARTAFGVLYNKHTDASNSYRNTVGKWIGGDLSAKAYDSVTQEHLGDFAQPESQADLQQAAEKMNAVTGIGMGGLTAKALNAIVKFPITHPKLATAAAAALGLSADDNVKRKPIPKESYEAFNKQSWANDFRAIYPDNPDEATASLIRSVKDLRGSLDNREDVQKAYMNMSKEFKNGN